MWYTLRLRDRAPPPLGGVNISSSIKIRCPGDNKKVRLGFRTAVFSVAFMSGRLSITGGRSLPVCRGRAPCRCSLGGSQSSRCVFDKVCSSRISESGTSETSLFLSCEGIVISSSSVGVSNSTLPSSDASLLFHMTKSPGPTAHEPEHQSPRYQLHSIMSIRLASHYIFTSPCFYHIHLHITSNISRNLRLILLRAVESSGPTARSAGLA